MKLFVKLMLALLVLAVLLPFTILKDQNGNTLMSFSDLGLPDFSMPSMPKANLGSSSSTQRDIFYQWKDASGTVQFTTQPPPEGVEYEIKKYNPNSNVIKAVEVPEPEEEKPEGEAGAVAQGDQPSIQIGSPYNPDDIKKLIDDAQSIEQKLQQRYEDNRSALN